MHYNTLHRSQYYGTLTFSLHNVGVHVLCNLPMDGLRRSRPDAHPVGRHSLRNGRHRADVLLRPGVPRRHGQEILRHHRDGLSCSWNVSLKKKKRQERKINFSRAALGAGAPLPGVPLRADAPVHAVRRRRQRIRPGLLCQPEHHFALWISEAPVSQQGCTHEAATQVPTVQYFPLIRTN